MFWKALRTVLECVGTLDRSQIGYSEETKPSREERRKLRSRPVVRDAGRERLRKLALETVDLNKDPYFMRNHLGTYECKLCLTLHNTEGTLPASLCGIWNSDLTISDTQM